MATGPADGAIGTNTGRPDWPIPAGTGLGPMPGSDPDESMRMVAGEMPELPFLPQLPARGVGADPVGRSIAMLVDIWADVVPSGWRTSRRPSRDGRRGKDFLAWDLDAAEQHLQGAPALKLQICGPWTLAALLEVPAGHRALTDQGAVADLTASLAEGLALHIAEVQRRLPGTELVIQIDEPLLPAVLAGSLSTASGFATVRSIEQARVGARLSEVIGAVGNRRTIGHCPDIDAPRKLLRTAGFDAVTLDFTVLPATAGAWDALGELISDGSMVLGGVIPALPPVKESSTDRSAPGRFADAQPGLPSSPDSLTRWAAPITEPLRALGFSPATVAGQIIATPTGGLAEASSEWTRRALSLTRDVSRLLAEGSPRLLAD